MPSNRTVVTITIALFVVLTAGCMGLSGDDDGELTGDFDEEAFDDFIENAIEAEDEIESYSFAMDMTMSGDQGSIGMSANGNADHAAQEMKASFSMSGDLMPPGPSSFDMYVDGNDAYFEFDGEWMTMPASEAESDFWNVDDEFTIDEAQYSYGDVHVEEDGDLVHVTTELDSDDMDAFIEATEEFDPAAAEDAAQFDWDDVVMVDTFDAETYHLISTEMVAEIEQMGETFEYEFEMTIDDIDEDLDTAVPEEAIEEAEEMNGQGF